MVWPLRRRRKLPGEIRAQLDQSRPERVLASAASDAGWAVATTGYLNVLPAAGPLTRRPWSDVAGARVDAETAELTITWVDASAPTVVRLGDAPGDFPRTVRRCVASSILLSERVRIGGSDVRVVLRRGPDGGLLTQVLGTGDVDLADPATAALVDAAEARVRETAGLR